MIVSTHTIDCWFDDTIFDSRFEAAMRSWAQQSTDIAQLMAQDDTQRIAALTQPVAALAFVLDGLILGISDYVAMRRAMILAIGGYVPVAALVLGPPAPLELLLVGGTPVVERGELRTADPAEAAREVRAARRRLADPG